MVVQAGDSLNQCIFYAGRNVLERPALEALYAKKNLLFTPTGEEISPREGLHVATGGDALLMTLDLDQDVVGFVAKRSFHPIHLREIGTQDARLFFDPIPRPRKPSIVPVSGRLLRAQHLRACCGPPRLRSGDAAL